MQIQELSLAVVIPAYNASATIRSAIKSAIEAGAEQVLVVDDGSTDATADLARDDGAIVIQQSNSGAYAARAAGVAFATSTFAILLDADDVLLPVGVGAAIDLLTQDNYLGAIIGSYVEVAPNGNTRQNRRTQTGVSASELIRTGFAPAPPSAVVWRTKYLMDAISTGCQPTNCKLSEDYELLIRGALVTNLKYAAINVCMYTVGSGRSYQNQHQQELDALTIRQHYSRAAGVLVKPRNRRAMLAARRKSQGRSLRLESRPAAAMASYAHAFALQPSDLLAICKHSLRWRESLARQGRKSPSILQDWSCNRGDLRVQVCLVLFRLASKMRQPRDKPPKRRAIPIGVAYRVVVQYLLGIEIPWRTRVGPRLRVYHGYGLVVNDEAVIGGDVVLRHGVTIGHRVEGEASPQILDGVIFGANAIVLGPVTVGSGATIAAGSVVLEDVPAGKTYRGLPRHWSN